MKRALIILAVTAFSVLGLYIVYKAAWVSNTTVSDEVLYPDMTLPEGAEQLAPAETTGALEMVDEVEPVESSKRYVGESPEECAVIRFVCEDGEEYFADEVGCGCQQSLE